MGAQARIVLIEGGPVTVYDHTLASDKQSPVGPEQVIPEGIQLFLPSDTRMELRMQPSGTAFWVRGRKIWTFAIENGSVLGAEGGLVKVPQEDIDGPVLNEGLLGQVQYLEREIAELRLELAGLYNDQPAFAGVHLERARSIIDGLPDAPGVQDLQQRLAQLSR